ncbi:hypothetical protein ACIBW9_34640 [Streptomyces sp. NPDC049541]|uniref:hypothetical protein n=1 Tax=Streptomyces sp. NPDC049541 TaxID=3365594 RepID=UPI00379DC6EA
MLGLRGVRLALLHERLCPAQAEALFTAWVRCRRHRGPAAAGGDDPAGQPAGVRYAKRLRRAPPTGSLPAPGGCTRGTPAR